jgi:ABC-type uncharacterized transport system permease subunit
MWHLKAYWRILVISAREEGANPRRLISSVVQLLARMALIVAIYHAAYLANPNPGLSYQNTVWSIGFYLTFVLALGLRNITRLIDYEIKAGTVETSLIKPLDWRIVALFRLLGKSGLEFAIQLVLIPALLWATVGLPDISFITWPMVPIFIVLTVLVAVAVAALFATVGMTAFWLNDAMSTYRIVDKAMAAFGGAFVPIALMPVVLQNILRWSPFGVYASPQGFFNPKVSSILLQWFISAVIWAALLVLFCQWVWKRAEKRLEVNGG